MKKCIRAISAMLAILICLSCAFSLAGCGDDGKAKAYKKNTGLDTSAEITLRIASSKETWPEMENVIAEFEKIYPNCTIVCEYIEEYSKMLDIRLEQSEQKIDIFRTVNIQEGTVYRDKALNLISEESKKILDLSGTNPGLLENFKYMAEENTQYAVPYGGEMRGMYVNVTLLNKFGLSVPKNRAELLNCCKVLYDNGYVPLQSSCGTFGQQFLYPYICNMIVNGGDYERVYASVENIDAGISEYFRDAYALLYEIVEKGYFDYSRVEEEYGYKFGNSNEKAMDFLNIVSTGDDEYAKKDDEGKIAFMIDTQAFNSSLSKMKSDYHSGIEYVFITSPVGVDGGYAYLSPSDGLGINKNSDNIDWSLEFLNFFFTPEITTVFAEETGKIPNTADALLKYDIPAERACDVGQVTFSYGFYKTVTTLLLTGYEDMIGIGKMNAEKYMTDNGDGTYSLKFTLDDYMERLEAEFMNVKNSK